MEAIQHMDFGNGLIVPIETDADLSPASKEPIGEAKTGELPPKKPVDYSRRHKNMDKHWTELDRAYLRKNWPLGTSQKDRETQVAVARNLGRTTAACAQQIYAMNKTHNTCDVARPKIRMVAAHSPNMTFAEQQEIAELFGSFTPEMKAVILALRSYEKPRIMLFDYEKHKLEIDFYPPKK